jgi:hypothetical protein
LQGRLGHPELVDPPAQHLEGAGQGAVVDLVFAEMPVGAVLGLQDDLGAAAQVEAQPGRAGDRHPAGGTDQQ